MAAGIGYLVCGYVDLAEDIAQLMLKVAHGYQNTLEISHISVPVLGMDIQVLIGQLAKQVTDIMDDRR